jgi:hypothetical protein
MNIQIEYLADASYIRLQNIQFGYSLPAQLVSRLFLQNVRIYFSGENLLTFDKLPKGMDPVALQGYYGRLGSPVYGADRIYSFGINVTY